MSDARTRKPKETPEQRAKKKATQIIAGVIVIIACIGIAFYAQTQNKNGAYIWIIGLLLGYVLQRSRFCFTAAMRDPMLTGSTSLTKALIMALTLSSILFAAMQIKATGWNLKNVNFADVKLVGNIAQLGWNTVLGGLLFGIGAVIAGGCASGTLMRMGEGFLQQWIAIIFFIIGTMIANPLMNSLTKGAKPVHLPQALGGWLPALLIQFGALFILYALADWFGKKKTGE